MRQTIQNYICDECGKTETAEVIRNVSDEQIAIQPVGWLRIRLEFRRNRGKWDACSVECAQVLVEREAPSVSSIAALSETAQN